MTSSWSHALKNSWFATSRLTPLLWPAAAIWGGAHTVRKWVYGLGWIQAQQLPVPVVVVGNLIIGGAGKTPTVMAVVRLLQRHGFSPGIISRGYGRTGHEPLEVQTNTQVTQCGDEPLLMRLRTKVPVVVAVKRAAAGRFLLQKHPEVNVLVSDDGLQHLQLARDAQVLVFDERGAGNGRLLPAGPLREPLPLQVPARSLVVYNASQASTPLPGTLAQRALGGAVALAAWRAGQPASLEALKQLRLRPLTAAAGLAQPERFFSMLRDHGLQISPLPLPDHFNYSTLPWPKHTADVVVTEKDAVKLDPARMGAIRVWVATLDFALSSCGEQALMALLPALHSPDLKSHGNKTD
jgi:tetraacyldisaccharide 4'-kinase